MNFAKKTKIGRMLAGIDSIEKLAELVGTSYTTIQRVEAGLPDGSDYPVKAHIKEKIIEILDIKEDGQVDEKLLEKLLDERAKRAIIEDRLKQCEIELKELKGGALKKAKGK